jgi:hypothetical protein
MLQTAFVALGMIAFVVALTGIGVWLVTWKPKQGTSIIKRGVTHTTYLSEPTNEPGERPRRIPAPREPRRRKGDPRA